MTQLILGLGNKARHGKDSFAEAVTLHFANQHAAALKHGLKHTEVKIQRLAFADALYKEVNEFLTTYDGQQFLKGNVVVNVDSETSLPSWVERDENAEKSTRAPYGKHPKLLQWWGTEYRRSQDLDYWVKKWEASIDPKADIVLTTDMRFTNEAEYVKKAGGYTVRLSRRNVDGTPFVDPSRSADHISETQLDDYNYDYRIDLKTGDLALLDQWAVALTYYLRALKRKA